MTLQQCQALCSSFGEEECNIVSHDSPSNACFLRRGSGYDVNSCTFLASHGHYARNAAPPPRAPPPPPPSPPPPPHVPSSFWFGDPDDPAGNHEWSMKTYFHPASSSGGRLHTTTWVDCYYADDTPKWEVRDVQIVPYRSILKPLDGSVVYNASYVGITKTTDATTKMTTWFDDNVFTNVSYATCPGGRDACGGGGYIDVYGGSLWRFLDTELDMGSTGLRYIDLTCTNGWDTKCTGAYQNIEGTLDGDSLDMRPCLMDYELCDLYDELEPGTVCIRAASGSLSKNIMTKGRMQRGRRCVRNLRSYCRSETGGLF